MTTKERIQCVRATLSSGPRPLQSLLATLFLFWCAMAQVASGAALSQQVVQQFFVPFPETDFKTSLQAIAGGTSVSTQMQSIVSIVVGTTNTIIVYDHWEDGYENDINSPTQPNTQVWGDGILTNGVAPGYTNDILPPGAVITLTNLVTLPRNPSTVRYDGRDRIGATRPVTVSKAGWSTGVGTLLASATEVYDTSRYGTFFIIPVGTNTTPSIESFSYSSLHIVASQNGTVVTVDKNGDGIMDVTNTLNMGESMFIDGGVLAGATVTASKPVQVHQLTGRIGSNYQSRTFAIRPVDQWDSNYYAPVGTTVSANSHNVFIFNPYPTNITVLYSTRTNSGSFTVTNKIDYKFLMPLNSGARFYTTNGATFYAVGCSDSGSSTPGNNQNFDWGYALLPAAALTPVVIVGWAPGSDDQDAKAGPDQNGSPVWVTPTKATTIYVNYSGNYATGPLVAPNGHHYDTNYALVAYQFQTIFNPTTKNMTGARIFTSDGTTFAAAWGEDPSVASQGAPYLDAGTGIIPFPVPNITKTSALVVDQDGNGKLSWGDTLEYTIRVRNDGMLVLGNVLVLDALPISLNYVTNSTTVNGTPVADNPVPPATSAFPLDEAGLILPQIQVSGFSEIKYRVTVAVGSTAISNSVLASAGGTAGTGDDTVTSTESVLAAPPVTVAFTDATGTPVSAYLINSGIYVTLTDLAQNTNAGSAQTVSIRVTNVSNGDWESVVLVETGTNSGIFRNTNALPSSISSGSGATNGTLLALSGNTLSVAYTDPITTNSGSATATIAASPLPAVSKRSQLVTDLNSDGRIGWGDTVSYSIVLTNGSAFAISNLVVRDVLPTNVTYVSSSTTSNGFSVADSGTTPFPLDESGFQITVLPTGSSRTLSFLATVNAGTVISNSVTVTNAAGQVQAQDVANVLPPPPTCNLSFVDASGNPLSLSQENNPIFASLTDTSRNTDPTTVQTVTVTITNLSNNDVESLLLIETGTNTGIFRSNTGLASSTSAGGGQNDGTLFAHSGQVLSVLYTGPSSETCSAVATMIPAIQTKKLYLSADNSSDLYQNLDRIDPVAAGKTGTSNSVVLANGSTATFVQTPSFCSGFFLPAGGTIGLTNYFAVTSGTMPAAPAITATLKKGTNAATASAFITLSNPGTNNGALRWSGSLPASVTVNSGEMIFLVITSAQSGVTFSLQYNSSNKPSFVALPTTTVITLDQLGVYDAPYPGGTLITNATSAQTVYLRASASDPFGSYDVTTMGLSVLDPGGFTFATNLNSAYVVSSNSCSKIFEYPWVAENWQGGYIIRGTAFEGTEGITNSLLIGLQVAYPPGGTPSSITFIDGSGNPTNSYATNQTVCVRVTDLNRNLNPSTAETITAVITTTTGDSETVTLTETATNTGVFTGCISANTNNASSGNGVLNAAGGSGLTVTYTDPFNPSDSVSDTAIVRTPPGPTPKVNVFKTLVTPANGNILLGNTVQFDITVGNPGSVTVTNVKLTDTFPAARLQFASATISPDSNAPAGTLTWTNLGPLASGQSVTISTFFNAIAAGALTNSASVTGTTNAGPAVAIASNTAPAIAISKTIVSPIPGPAYINSNVVFRIAITNIGSTTISSYLLQDQFSSACFQFLGASIAPSGSGGGIVLWTALPSLAPGASTVIFVTNKVTGSCSPALNTATISSAVDSSGTSVPSVQSSASIENVGAAISGTVWYDSNVNATNDAGDSALSSVIVYADLNGNGVREGSEPFGTTDTNGVYQITSLPAGSYAARVDTNSLLAGVRPTYDFDGTNTPHSVSLSVTNGQVFTNINFGYVGSGSISGTLWNDFSADGVRQPEEAAIPGAVVFIDANGNGARDVGELSTTTDTNGVYTFTNLVATSYRVAVDLQSLPNGVGETYDVDGTNTLNVATVNLAAGQNMASVDFGYLYFANLSGYITDSLTGSPIPGAKVVIVDFLGGTQRATTDGSGHYYVPFLWLGPAKVTASKSGYAPSSAFTFIFFGSNTQDLALVPNTLSGVIRDASTTLPITGARVVVVDSANVTNIVITGAGGTYSVTNIAVGTATVSASKTGYTGASVAPVIVQGSNAQDLNLTPNTLSGLVTDSLTGLAISGATVSVTDSSNIVHSVSTDGTGHYTVSNLSTGPANVTVSKVGYSSATSSPTIVPGTNTQNAVLTPNILTGVIRDAATTLPITGATVVVIDAANVTNTIITATNGAYGITNISAGIANISAAKTGYSSASTNSTIVVGANTQDLSLVPNTLTGQVTDSLTGLAISGATVAVTDSSNVVHTATTDGTGHYGIPNLPTGPATVTVSKTGYSSATSSPIIVPGTNVQNAVLTPNILTGVIRDNSTSLPISGATVVVIDNANVTNTTTTAADGTYGVTNIATGVATVTASKSGYANASAAPTIVVGNNTQDLNLTPNTLGGQVTDTLTGLPIGGVTVGVTDSSNVVHTVSTDGTGHYSFSGLPTGPATVTAAKTGYSSATTPMTIVVGVNTQNEVLTPNILTGVVRDASTTLPISGATVTVVDNANVTNVITTGANGFYGVTNIAAGIASVTATKSGYGSATAAPTIVVGSNVQDLSLTPNTLGGQVTDSLTGLPIAGASVGVTDSSNVVHTVSTDGTGHYSFSDLPTGPAALTAGKTGYSSASTLLTIVVGSNTQNEVLTPNILTGVIRDAATALPISGATVVVVDNADITNTITTGTNGFYSVTNIAVGVATVTASQSGYSSATAGPTIVVGNNAQDLNLTPNALGGQVTDSLTGLRIGGATVVVTDSSNVVHTVSTDGSGFYGITNLPTGSANVTASKTGYSTATSSLNIVAGTNIQNEVLVPNILTGVVRDSATSLPISGATVVVVDNANVTNTITTGASGFYGVTNIAVGVASVTASKSGYSSATAGPTIVVGNNTQDLNLTPNTLAGQITDSLTGLPISGATVVVTDSSNVVHTVSTDGSGNYGVTNIPTGSANVTASKTGYATATSTPIIVSGPNTQNEALTPNILTGVVRDASTALPINGATVIVVDSANVTNTIFTGANGFYGVTNIAAGGATVTASKTGYSSASASPTIVVGNNTQDLNLTANTLVGQVTDSLTGLPISGATVVVTDSSNVVHTVSTDGSGNYGVTNIPTGSASVSASKTGYATATSTPIIAAGPNTQDEQLTPNILTGIVRDASTALPISGATVIVIDNANVTNTITTSANGSYGVTNIAAGGATVTASKTGYSSASASPTIVVGNNTQDLNLTANTLVGQVTDSLTGLPISGATVVVTDSSNVVHTVSTDGSGNYGVTNLPTGSAIVAASKTGYTSASASPVIVVGNNLQDLSLTPNTLSGQITDSLTGLPISGATVVVTDSSNVVHTVSSDGTGHYGVTNLPTGSANVAASKTGYTTASSSLNIAPGSNTQNEALTAITLVGQITDATTHLPISGATVTVIDSLGATNSLTSDASGNYGVTNLPTGGTTVTASKSGYNSTNAVLTIVAGPNTQDLQLAASSPTLALISLINAYTSGDGVLVRWQTASEVGSVSFDLYRQASTGGQWTKVNDEPVIAANTMAGATYDVSDATVKPLQTAQYKIVETEELGTKREYGPFTLRATSPVPTVASKAVASVTPKSSTGNQAQVHISRVVSQTTPVNATFVKIATTNAGVQHVTATALANALGQTSSAVQQQIAAGQFQLSNQGAPVGYLPDGDGSGFSFYAEALKNNYTAQNVYLLKTGANAALPSVGGANPGSSTSAGTYLAELDLEQDLLAAPTLVQDANQDFWMWQRLVAGLAMFDTANLTFTLDHLSSSGTTAHITLRLLGASETTHAIQVTLNGTVIGQDTWQGRSAHNTVLDIPANLLVSGANQLSLKAVKTGTSATSQWYLNNLSVFYPRQYVAQNGALTFGANSNAIITVDGFTSGAITVLDITDSKNPVVLSATAIAPSQTGYSATFVPATADSRFVAFQAGAGSSPANVTSGQIAGLGSGNNAADYLIIAPASLSDGAAQLAAYRQQKGLRTLVANLDQVYNEFSYGVATPFAIKQLLTTARAQWSVKPQYVILLGDGTYDYRDLLQKHDNLMPPLLLPTAYGLFCSDTAYGDLDNNGLPQIAIGRLPVKTADQLTAVINKIKAYEANTPATGATALLMSDVPDTSGNFADAIQQVNATLSGVYSNDLMTCTSQDNVTTVRQSVQSALAGGVDLFNYIGHGAIDRFGNSGYLTSSDVSALQTGNRLPVVVAVTCVAGQFSTPGSDSLAEYLTLQNGGGAIAVIAPTGLSVNQDASRLNLRLMQLLRVNTGPGLGDMFRQAVSDHVAFDKPATQPAIYNLIGDPALAYNVVPQVLSAAPRFTAVSTSNGNLLITWSGGKAPYQLETRSSLNSGTTWQAVGAPVTGNSTTIPLNGPVGFVRIRCSQ